MKDEKDFLELNYNKSFGNELSFFIRGFWNYYEFFEKDPYEDYIYILPAKNYLYGAEVKINYLLGNHFLSFGSEWRRFKVDQSYYLTYLNGEKIEDSEVLI